MTDTANNNDELAGPQDGVVRKFRVRVNIAFASLEHKHGMDNWFKVVFLDAVPRIGETLWVFSNDDYLVTDVSHDLSTAEVTVRCADDTEYPPEDVRDWIECLLEDGFTTE